MASLIVTVQPTIEPITVAEAQAHLREGSGNVEPVPAAPTVALAGAGAGNVNSGVHRYAVTFVTADGETSSGDISSAVTTTGGDGRVSITSIPLGGSAVTSRKLYRTAAGGSTYLLLATIADNTTTSYTDNIADSSLGAEVPTANTTADPELTIKMKAARLLAETMTSRCFITQTLRYTANRFPCGNVIWIPRHNLLTVTSVQYVDTNGDTQTFSSSDYTVDTAEGRILLNYGGSWPSTRSQENAVTITFTAGYGPARSDVPADVKSLILLLLGGLWEYREEKITGTIQSDNKAVDALAWANRVFPLPNEYMEAPV